MCISDYNQTNQSFTNTESSRQSLAYKALWVDFVEHIIYSLWLDSCFWCHHRRTFKEVINFQLNRQHNAIISKKHKRETSLVEDVAKMT